MLHPFRFWWIACAVGAVGAASGPVPAPDSAGLARATAALAQAPLRFESNQGQWQPGVRFRARTGGYTVSLTDRGAVVGIAGGRGVEITMAGANPAPAIEPAGPQQVRTNYFLGPRERWHTGVANYSRVRYRGVYQGIDVVYYGGPRQLEYDFVLSPGADPSAIRIGFSGAGRVRVTRAGDLEVDAVGGGRVLQKKPAIYQDGRVVEGGYRLLAHNMVGLRLGAYDRSRILVIDPVLSYATYLGGLVDDLITVVKMDPQGRLYVTGTTGNGGATIQPGQYTDMGFTPGAYSDYEIGFSNIFLAIFDTTGDLSGTQYGLLYLSYIGGSNRDVPNAMTLDSLGNVYITGNTTSTNFPQVGNTVAVAAAAYTMGFVIQMNPAINGPSSLLYSTYLGGTDGNTFANAIGVDAVGNIYVLGSCQADDFPVTANAFQGVRWGSQDILLAELNPASTVLVYATYLGGELDDDGRAMVVMPSGLVYFAGSTESTQFPLAGNAFQTALSGNTQIPGYDLVFGVLDTTQFGLASLVYSTYLGGSDNEETRAMTMDAKGNLLLTGYTLSTNFPVTPDAAQPVYGGNGDAFVVMVNPNTPGFLVYSTYLGGSDADVGYGVASDSSGFIYATGYTLSADYPVANAVQPNWGGLVDVFVAKLQPGVQGTAGLAFSTYIGAQSINQGSTMLVGPDGRVYVAGYTGGEFPVTANAYQGVFGGGGSDGFLMVLTQ